MPSDIFIFAWFKQNDVKSKPPYGYWKVKRNVIEDAKKYMRRADWKRNSPGAYQSAYTNNWISECCKHFKSGYWVKYGYWIKKRNLIKDASKYKTRKEWEKNSASAYQSACKNGWLEICCKHMVTKVGKWKEKKNVINDSKKYKTRSEWIKNSGSAYSTAVRNGWLSECYAPKA